MPRSRYFVGVISKPLELVAEGRRVGVPNGRPHLLDGLRRRRQPSRGVVETNVREVGRTGRAEMRREGLRERPWRDRDLGGHL
jgi:hypothetical protein